VTLLIDTHCWLRWLTEPGRLRASALSLLNDGATKIPLSAASTWEIAIKYSLGKLDLLPQHPDEFIPVRLRRDRIQALAIEHSRALQTAGLPYHHRDPFDRLLIAQAMVLDIPIMTADPAFAPYEIEVIRS